MWSYGCPGYMGTWLISLSFGLLYPNPTAMQISQPLWIPVEQGSVMGLSSAPRGYAVGPPPTDAGWMWGVYGFYTL